MRTRGFRIGHRVILNEDWSRNVHLGGGPESESPVPGGTPGIIVSRAGDPDCWVVETALGPVTAHESYLDRPIKGPV